ncbi:MAG: type I-C CRISPR-associated endonuclease Cas1c [Anaerorhabdus sp.]
MKILLNTLYVTSPDSYLSIDGENIVILEKNKVIGRIPLHNLESIVAFGYRGVSPALMGGCVERNISLSFMTPQGKYLASITGKIKGNVLLRKKQYRVSENTLESMEIAKNCILGKVYNTRWIIERAKRDHPLQVDVDKLNRVSTYLKNSLLNIRNCNSLDELRGYEGEAASVYFSVFNELILQQKKHFIFEGRNRRPPLDKVNALLSFTYTLLSNMVSAALESVGLDPYVGFMHVDRPGRISLALDLMEELRPVLAERFVLNLINKKIITEKDFLLKEDGAVLLSDNARKRLLVEWQNKKKTVIRHPYLDDKIEWGMVPYAQAMLLARFLRGDIDEYPPFFWK